MVVHAFNSRTPEAEVGGSLDLRPVYSVDIVSGQPNLDGKGNHQKQKASEDIN